MPTIVPQAETPCEIAGPEFHRNRGGYAMARGEGSNLHHTRLAALVRRPSKRHVAAHRCRNRDCVRLDHLYWATYEQNAYDRKTQGTETFGERNGMAKITAAHVDKIRWMRDQGMTHQAIADAVGTSRPNVSNILRGARWGHHGAS